MKTLTYESEKEIARDILKLLDGLPYSGAKRIIETVSRDIFEGSYVELKPFQTLQVSLGTEKMDELIGLMEEFNRNHPAGDEEPTDEIFKFGDVAILSPDKTLQIDSDTFLT